MVDNHFSSPFKEMTNAFLSILIFNPNNTKVHVISDKSLIARSGGAADTQHVAEIVQRKVGNS